MATGTLFTRWRWRPLNGVQMLFVFYNFRNAPIWHWDQTELWGERKREKRSVSTELRGSCRAHAWDVPVPEETGGWLPFVPSTDALRQMWFCLSKRNPFIKQLVFSLNSFCENISLISPAAEIYQKSVHHLVCNLKLVALYACCVAVTIAASETWLILTRMANIGLNCVYFDQIHCSFSRWYLDFF